eukprot:6214288-Pleurochrysis_carterae.AAC.3
MDAENILVAEVCVQLTILQRCILAAMLACETAAYGARVHVPLAPQHVVCFLMDTLQDTGTSICSNLCYRLVGAYLNLCDNKFPPTTGVTADDLRLMHN